MKTIIKTSPFLIVPLLFSVPNKCMAKKKFYVVWEGHEPGIYSSWTECLRQVKNFPGAKYKSFTSLSAAEEAFSDNSSTYIAKSGVPKKKSYSTIRPEDPDGDKIIWDSLSVDAACSGNPGKMEYQGVDTRSGERIFHQSFPLGTNNIGEFLGLVHGLAWLKQQKSDIPVYTDSAIAMKWIKAKKCRTKLKRTNKTAFLYELIARGEKWLEENTYDNPILKWDTKNWGEIPADFGRKG